MKKLVAIFLLVLAGAAHANAPSKWYWVSGWFQYPNRWHTPDEACQAGVPLSGYPTYHLKAPGQYYSANYACMWAKADGYETTASRLDEVMLCDDKSYPDTSKPLDSQCGSPPPPPPCTAGKTGQGTWSEGHSSSASAQVPDGPPGGFPSSDGQCEIVPDEVVRCYSVPGSGGGKDFFCTYNYHQTGTQKAGTPPTANPPTTNQNPASQPPVSDPTPGDGCPKGTSQVGVDSSGIPMCAGNGTSPNSPPIPPKTEQTQTTNNADGSTTTTKTTTQQNSDGSTTTTTTTTTTGADGKTTTSTTKVTGKASDGRDGKEDSNPDDNKYDLCKSHPELNICRNSSVTGTCGQITCSGDAIQCSILREQAARNCSDKADIDAMKQKAAYTLGGQMEAGNDPLKSQLPTPGNAQQVQVGNVSGTGWLGSGSCFPDKTFTVRGYQFTLSFTKACEPLLAFRYVLMTIALLASFRMLGGVIFRE